MRSFKAMLIVIAYMAALLLLSFVFLVPFMGNEVTLYTLTRSPLCYVALLLAQFVLIIMIAPAMTAGAIAGERERQTLDLLLVTNTGSLRIVAGKVMESFAMLGLLIVCGLPVMSLCLLTGGVNLLQILLGEVFLLAEAFACVSVGVFCSSLSKSTVVSTIMSYISILLFGAITALPLVFGYPQRITDVLYDRAQYAALEPAGALAMIPPLMLLNPGFGMLALVQLELHAFSSAAENLYWGRIMATWLMADRAGWLAIVLICVGGMLLISMILLAISALMIRRKKSVIKN